MDICQFDGHFRRPKQAWHGTSAKKTSCNKPSWRGEWEAASDQIRSNSVKFKRIGFVKIRSVVSPNATLDWMHMLLAYFNPRLRSISYPRSYKFYLLSALDRVHPHFLDKGLHNPASTSKDVHSQLLQTKAGLETQQTKVKTRCID
jgi:hypothetical protein